MQSEQRDDTFEWIVSGYLARDGEERPATVKVRAATGAAAAQLACSRLLRVVSVSKVLADGEVGPAEDAPSYLGYARHVPEPDEKTRAPRRFSVVEICFLIAVFLGILALPIGGCLWFLLYWRLTWR